MSVSFKKTEFVTATLTLLDTNGVVTGLAGIQPGTLVWASSNTGVFDVTVPDATQPHVAKVIGFADGDATLTWSAVNTAGQTITGSDPVSISDTPVLTPAVSGTIAYSDPQPQVAAAA